MKRKRKTGSIDEARRHIAAGRVERARAVVARVLEARPDDRAAHEVAAMIEMIIGAHALALEHLDRVPPSAWVYFGRARALEALGRYDEALDALRRSRDLDPADAGLYQLEATIRRGQGDLDGALDALSGALALEPGSTTALAMKADLLLEQGKDDEALDTFRAAVRSREGTAAERAALLRRFAAILAERGIADEAEAARGLADQMLKN